MKLKGIVTVRGIKSQAIDRNREAIRLFETCINTNDLELGRKLIAGTAAFKTTISERTVHTPTGILSPYLNANLSAKIKTRKQ